MQKEKESHKYRWINVFYDPGLGTKKGQDLNLASGKYVGA